MKNLKYFFVLVLFFLLHRTLIAQNISPQFSELKGMEDDQGNTRLFYRIYSYQEQQPFGFFEDNSVYHINLSNQTDTLFLRESGSNMFGYFFQNDYEVINISPMHYINIGTSCPMECSPFAYNSDYGNIFENGSWGSSYKIAVGENPDLVYYGLDAWDMDTSITTLRSNDGGLNWDTLSSRKIFMSLNPYNNQISFYLDNLSQGVFKSSDGGSTFYIADTTQTFINPESPKFYYDSDQTHVYMTSIKGGQQLQYYLSVSDNQGEPFSWSNKYLSNDPIFFSNDESQSGAVYLADGKKIFYSSNYGNTFNLFKELDKKIIGIYKKPNSDKLYTATKYKIYEITNDTTTTIKSLPIVDELAFYPLKVGNKWIYDYTSTDWIMNSSVDIYYREVLSEKMKQNGKKYFEILEKFVYLGIIDTVYERIDTTEGKVYRYESDCPNSEQFIEELVLEINDSTFASRFESCIEHPPTELVSQQGYNLWGFYGMNRNYLSLSLLTSDYNLYSEIGLVYIKLSDDNYFRTFILKGMVKDGVVYGDTTLTDVGDENNSIPTVYRLEHNYPNPFNPTTKISWQSPSAGHQTLKVYDVLGNEVITLVDEYRNTGSYELDFDASNLSSGVYFYQLKAGDFISTQKMILIK